MVTAVGLIVICVLLLGRLNLLRCLIINFCLSIVLSVDNCLLPVSVSVIELEGSTVSKLLLVTNSGLGMSVFVDVH